MTSQPTGRIYLDHAATTPLDPRVLEAMLPYLSEYWGNASSLYALGYGRHENEPQRVLPFYAAFLAGMNLVILAADAFSFLVAWEVMSLASWDKIKRGFEHAVLHATERLEQEGFRLTYLGVDAEGFIDLAELEAAVTGETVLVSIMYVNNEVGSIEPVEDAVRVVKAKNPRTVFHTDAVQAAGLLDITVDRLGVDLLTLAAHKFYGPKGVGALYVRQRTPMQWQQLGGSQEKNRRAGTENVAGVVGMAKALELAYEEFESRNAHYRALRDRLLSGVPERVPGVHITGPNVILRNEESGEGPTSRSGGPSLPSPEVGLGGSGHVGRGAGEGRASNNASFCFEGIEGEAVLIALDLAGIAASSGSACTSGSLEASHVLTAMGVPEDLARGSMRLTVGTDNTPEQIERVLEVLPGVVSRIRALNPAATERQTV